MSRVPGGTWSNRHSPDLLWASVAVNFCDVEMDVASTRITHSSHRTVIIVRFHVGYSIWFRQFSWLRSDGFPRSSTVIDHQYRNRSFDDRMVAMGLSAVRNTCLCSSSGHA